MPKKGPRYPEKYSLPPLSDTRRPGKGFYQYINQEWLSKTKIPKAFSEYGVSEEVAAINRREIMAILKKYPSKSFEPGQIPSSAKEHIQFFKHVWHNSKPPNEEAFLKGIFNDLLSCGSDRRKLARILGWLSKAGINVLLDISIEEEHRAPYYYRKTLSSSTVTLPYKYYLNKSAYSESIVSAYEGFINACSIELGLPFLTYTIEAERDIAHLIDISPESEEIKEVRGRRLTDFPWDEFFDGLDCGHHWKEEYWLLSDPFLIQRLIYWFNTTTLEKLLALTAINILNKYAEYLRPSLRSAFVSCFYTGLHGIHNIQTGELKFINDLNMTLPDALCREFARVKHNSSNLKEVHELIEKIKTAAIDVISGDTILSKKAATMAVDKIQRMKINVGAPALDHLPEAKYFPDSFIHTHISIHLARTALRLSKVSKRPDVRRLTYPCYIVNASYYTEKNQVMIPWGILQCPYFCKGAPIGWNYGSIGVTVAHEISHAFDIDGSKYDSRARFRKWWTRRDISRFKRRTRKMARFFSKHKRLGMHLNGNKTLSENWADFGAIVISLNALKCEIRDLGLGEKDQREAIKTFFISYTVSWRDKQRKKSVIYKILKNVHSIPEDRVDLILPHFQEWVDAFDIKEDDPLFIPIEKRLRFF